MKVVASFATLLLFVPMVVLAANPPLFFLSWGTQGSGNGQFNWPQYIAVDSQDNVYVTDFANHRVQKFAGDGTFLTAWGSYGTGNGEFDGPSGVAVDSQDNIYVADNGNFRIQKFTSAGAFVLAWEDSAAYDITIDSQDTIYVTVSGYHFRIQKFTSDGTFLTEWGTDGTGNGEFSHPSGIAVDSQHNVFVVDTGNHRIQKFTSGGTFLTAWGSLGTGNGEFNSPSGIAVDSQDNVYVVGTNNHRVQEFTNDGTFLTAWGTEGMGDGEFIGPNGVAVNSWDNIYVVDTWNHRVEKFGSTATGIGDTPSFAPTSLECFPNPFNPTVTIRYTLTEPGPVTLGIYDVRGRLVQYLERETPQYVKTYLLTYEPPNIASGVYFVRLVANKHSITRKVTLLK